MEPIRSVGVAGAGVMGSELAQVFAGGGHDVVLVDVSEQTLDAAKARIARSLRLQRLIGGAAAATDRTKVLEQITFTLDYGKFSDVDFVVESVTEDWDVKERVYREIDAICPPRCVFSSNTSVIPITKLAALTGRAPNVVGTHFMNPVSLKPMVEVIRGHHTSEGTIALTRELLTGIGKECIVINDSPGFASNRVLMLTVNEAMFLVYEHVASAEDVDQLFRSCFGQKMGPLETADLIGLDTVLRSIKLLYEHLCDSKYRPCPLLQKMVHAGLYGRKSGQGFYTYGQGENGGRQG